MSIRRNRRATGEVNQSLAALVVIMMSVGLVMAAVHAVSSEGAGRAARERAQAQGDVCLDALVEDPELQGRPGTLSILSAQRVAAGLEALAFLPDSVKVVTLRAVDYGAEVWVEGDASALSRDLVFVLRPVAVETDRGAVVPGVLRVGVEVP